MCESGEEMKASCDEMDVLHYFPLTMIEFATHESWYEEHENDLSMRQEYFNLKRSSIDTTESIIQFCYPCPSLFLLSLG